MNVAFSKNSEVQHFEEIVQRKIHAYLRVTVTRAIVDFWSRFPILFFQCTSLMAWKRVHNCPLVRKDV